MIKFFRNIRQNLLMENKTSKYLKYAIGEIVLVVIGILIALQINNWNEGRKEVLREKQLLSNLQGEFEDNLQDLDSIALLIDEVIIGLEKVFDKFSASQSTESTDSLNIWLSHALQSPNWKPSEFLLNSLNNSGSIAELRNENLKLLLYKWSRQQKEMIDIQIRTEKTGEEIITYLKEYGSLRNVDTSNPHFGYKPSTLLISNVVLLSDPRFENYIDDKLYMYRTSKLWLGKSRKTLVQLIDETKR